MKCSMLFVCKAACSSGLSASATTFTPPNLTLQASKRFRQKNQEKRNFVNTLSNQMLQMSKRFRQKRKNQEKRDFCKLARKEIEKLSCSFTHLISHSFKHAFSRQKILQK